jgi:nucleotide-binding universal stress UspA family protein
MSARRILISYDGSPDGESALQEAARLARAAGGELIVAAPAPVERPSCCGNEGRVLWNHYLRCDAREHLREAALALDEELSVEYLVSEGEPARALPDAATSLGCDLVILPAARGTRIGRWLARDPERALRRSGHAVQRAAPAVDVVAAPGRPAEDAPAAH